MERAALEREGGEGMEDGRGLEKRRRKVAPFKKETRG
jgi:hypothetical protein